MSAYCSEPGCSELVPFGKCPTHRAHVDRARGSRHARGYTNRWDRRARAFRARFPLCGMRISGAPVLSECHELGRVRLADCVDHVVPHKGDHDLMWDPQNWQSLCNECHTRKTGKGL